MTAYLWQDVEIRCNGVVGGEPCTGQTWGSHADISDPITAAKVRKFLAARGWSTQKSPVRDYCPRQHDPEGTA